MFKIRRDGLFKITFKNGLTVSMTIAPGSYTDNHDSLDFLPGNFSTIQSSNAEVAVWQENGGFLTEKFTDDGDGGVAGYQSPEQILEILNKAAAWKPE